MKLIKKEFIYFFAVKVSGAKIKAPAKIKVIFF
jgi:hypothetical protein